MENLARKIQKINSYIGNKDYENAFYEMYKKTYSTNTQQTIDSIMSGHTSGNFLGACAIYEDMIIAEKERVEKAKKSPAVRKFREKYKYWDSGYSMGETVEIIYITAHGQENEMVADCREKYKGRCEKYNYRIKYGEATLFVDLTGSRMKTRVEIINKK